MWDWLSSGMPLPLSLMLMQRSMWDLSGVGIFLGPRANADVAVLGDGVDGVVEEVGPDLVEAGALGVQSREVGSEGFFDG